MRGVGGPLLTVSDLLSDLAVEGSKEATTTSTAEATHLFPPPPWQRIRWRKLTPPSSSGSSRKTMTI